MKQTLLTFLSLALMAAVGQAQFPEPSLTSIDPLGGQVGETVTVEVKGAEIDRRSELRFDHPGITARPVMQTKFGREVPVERKYEVTIGTDVPAGVYSVRATTPFGVTNSRRFAVGLLEEAVETEPNNREDEAQPIELDRVIVSVANGRGDIDHFSIELKSGTRILAELSALGLDSLFEGHLELRSPNGSLLASADAGLDRDPLLDVTVPGTGIYLLTVHDLAFNFANRSESMGYRLKVHTGPRVDFVFPPSGQPGKTEKFTLYGRNLPGGQPAGVRLDGAELDRLEVSIKVPETATRLDPMAPVPMAAGDTDGFLYHFEAGGKRANPVFIGISELPATPESEPNDTLAEAKSLPLPINLVGQLDQPGDRDSIRFEAKKDQVYVLEVFAQRLGRAVDPVLTIEQITEKDGAETARVLKTEDDRPLVFLRNVFDASGDDPHLVFTVPADGTYRVIVQDRYAASRGSADMVYQLVVRQPRPDFRPVGVVGVPNPRNRGSLSPGGLAIRRGGTVTIPIYLIRSDGFNGAVVVSGENLATGVSIDPQAIPPGELTANLIVRAASNAPAWDGSIDLVAEAVVDRDGTTETIRRQVRPISVSHPQIQNNFPPGTRLDDAIHLTILEPQLPWEVTATGPVVHTVNAGAQVLVPIKITRADGFTEPIKFSPETLPKDANLQAIPSLTFEKDQTEQTLRFFIGNKAKPGTYTIRFKADSKVLKYHRANESGELELLKADRDYLDGYRKTAESKVADAKKARDDAVKRANDAETARKAAEAKKRESEQKVKSTKDDARKAAEAELKMAIEALKKADEAKKQADLQRQEAENAVKDAEKELSDAAKALKTASDAITKLERDAEKGKDMTLSVPSVPVTITVRPAPVTLSAAVPSGGNLKRGAETAVTVKVNRTKEFTEPVRLTLVTPSGIDGVTASPVTVPADKAEGVLTIKASGNATEGTLEHVVIRAEMSAKAPYGDGSAAVDVPISLKISK